MLYNAYLKSLHIELSSHCNASCLGCSRTSEFSEKAHLPISPKNLELENIKNIFKDESVKKVDWVYLCGNLGDPLASPLFKEALFIIFEHLPKTRVSVHTNGSIGSQSLWRSLGSEFKDYNLKIVFSIDGLADTNQQYRVGVPWNAIMANAKAYIDNGGHAIWKFIKFPHSSHQITEAQRISQEMGFKEFQIREPYDQDRVPGKSSLESIKEFKSEYRPYKDATTSELLRHFSKKGKETIKCQAKEAQQIYIDSFGKAYPCCWLGNLGLDRRSIRESELFFRHVTKKYAPNFNSLYHFSLSEILRHPWFSKSLVDSLDNDIEDPTNPCIPTCLKHCKNQSR